MMENSQKVERSNKSLAHVLQVKGVETVPSVQRPSEFTKDGNPCLRYVKNTERLRFLQMLLKQAFEAFRFHDGKHVIWENFRWSSERGQIFTELT